MLTGAGVQADRSLQQLASERRPVLRAAYLSRCQLALDQGIGREQLADLLAQLLLVQGLEGARARSTLPVGLAPAVCSQAAQEFVPPMSHPG